MSTYFKKSAKKCCSKCVDKGIYDARLQPYLAYTIKGNEYVIHSPHIG